MRPFPTLLACAKAMLGVSSKEGLFTPVVFAVFVKWRMRHLSIRATEVSAAEVRISVGTNVALLRLALLGPFVETGPHLGIRICS